MPESLNAPDYCVHCSVSRDPCVYLALALVSVDCFVFTERMLATGSTGFLSGKSIRSYSSIQKMRSALLIGALVESQTLALMIPHLALVSVDCYGCERAEAS